MTSSGFILRVSTAAAMMTCLSGTSSFGDDVLAYGGYLAAECTACHRPQVGSGLIPPIAGLPEAYFEQAMHAYKSGERSNAVMGNVAVSLGDDEIAALARYFNQLEKMEAKQ